MRRPLPAEVSSRLEGIKPAGDQWVARCPIHEDRSPSLTLRVGDDGKLLVHCHAGCDARDVLTSIHASEQLIHGEQASSPGGQLRGEWTPRGEAVAVYHYVDERSELLYDVCRTADKQFPQRRPDPAKKGGWTWSLGEARRVLYRLPQVIAAVQAGQTIWITEGEKDVHALETADVVATCAPGGAGKWRDVYAEVLRGADVVVVADKDKPGQAHARQVAVSLGAVDARVRIVEARAGKDAADHLAAGLRLDEFLTTHESETAVAPDLAPELYAFLDGDDPGFRWLMPGILEQGDRLMVTGYEGWGKSTLIRQLALGLASGVHAFAPAVRFAPSRVLFIDCENSERQLRRGLGRILFGAVMGTFASPPEVGQMHVINRVGGVDLTRPENAEWLMERAVAHKPDVIFLGPLYYLYAEGGNDEAPMRRVQAAIDAVRERLGCAFVIEAHPGHGQAGQHRQTRVAGSSVWMRWLESGVGLSANDQTDPEKGTPVTVHAWKKHRFERCWPKTLCHGTYSARDEEFRTWPWVPNEPYRIDPEMDGRPTATPKRDEEMDLAELTGSRIPYAAPAEERYTPRDDSDPPEVSNPSTQTVQQPTPDARGAPNGASPVPVGAPDGTEPLSGFDEGFPEPPLDLYDDEGHGDDPPF